MMRQFGKLVVVSLFSVSISMCASEQNPNRESAGFDWQGHRGARGLAPENTIPAFLKALEYPVTTLELDVVVSADKQVVVSHEPYMSAEICTKPNGEPVSEVEALGLNLFAMPYDSIRQYDCGRRGNRGFPEQKAQAVSKPLLTDMISAVEAHCEKTGRSKPRYNIEIKSRRDWYNAFVPPPEEFVQGVMADVEKTGVKERVSIQSFDPGVLQALDRLYPDVEMVYLVTNRQPLSKQLELLGVTPDVYSPNYRLLTAEIVKQAHAQGLRVIPWTVNEVPAMRSLMEMGVDGIITDYPNRIAEADEANRK